MKKGRKYPIKHDELGKSARGRSFEAFDRGLRPMQVSRELGINRRTAYRYFADWKKRPNNVEARYRILKSALKSHPELREEIAREIALREGVTAEEALERLQKPWAIKQLVSGKWAPNVTQRTKHANRDMTTIRRFALILQLKGVSPEVIKTAWKELSGMSSAQGSLTRTQLANPSRR